MAAILPARGHAWPFRFATKRTKPWITVIFESREPEATEIKGTAAPLPHLTVPVNTFICDAPDAQKRSTCRRGTACSTSHPYALSDAWRACLIIARSPAIQQQQLWMWWCTWVGVFMGRGDRQVLWPRRVRVAPWHDTSRDTACAARGLMWPRHDHASCIMRYHAGGSAVLRGRGTRNLATPQRASRGAPRTRLRSGLPWHGSARDGPAVPMQTRPDCFGRRADAWVVTNSRRTGACDVGEEEKKSCSAHESVRDCARGLPMPWMFVPGVDTSARLHARFRDAPECFSAASGLGSRWGRPLVMESQL